jgi:hypothetical protein
MWATCCLVTVSSAIWIGSIHVDVPNRYALIWIAILMDLLGHVPITLIMRAAQKSEKPGFIAKHLGKYFEFYPGTYRLLPADKERANIPLSRQHRAQE